MSFVLQCAVSVLLLDDVSPQHCTMCRTKAAAATVRYKPHAKLWRNEETKYVHTSYMKVTQSEECA